MSTDNKNTQNPDVLFAEDVAKTDALNSTLNAITTEQLQLSEQVGAIKAFDFTQKLLTVSTIKMLAEIKESKQYKGLKVIGQDGKLLTVSSWEDFCQGIGRSRQHVDLDILNLSAFGEDFLETSQRMGIGYRDLRKLRQIPDADREVIINGEALQAGDKDSLIELIEDMSVKHKKDKTKLENQVKDLTAEAKAKDRVIADKQKTIDDKNTELNIKDEKLALRSHAPAFERAKDYATQMDVFKIDSLQLFGNISALYEQIEQDDELPELLRVNMGHLLLEVKAQANNLIDHHMLGDVSVDDDDLSWMHNANAEIEARNQVIDVSGLSSDAARFQEWKTEQGYVSDDDDFALQGQTADEIANPPKGE